MWTLLVALSAATATCDAPQVTQPAQTGITWTRLTSTSVQNCLYPDLRGDSLVFTALGQNPGNPNFYDRLAFSLSDGSNASVTGYPGNATWTDYRPRWAGSGVVVYQSNRSGHFQIYYREVDTGADRRLFGITNNASAPAPRPGSPGLAYIEYDTNPGTAGSADLRGRIVLIPDTAAVPLDFIYLTPDTMRCGEPDWDATGQRLTFSVESSGDLSRHIYTLDLAPGDSIPKQLTTGAIHDYGPRWSPDGSKILFVSDRTARWGLWIVHPQGEANGLKLLGFEDANAAVFTPTWTPDGMSIIASSDGRGGVRSLWLISNLPDAGF